MPAVFTLQHSKHDAVRIKDDLISYQIVISLSVIPEQHRNILSLLKAHGPLRYKDGLLLRGSLIQTLCDYKLHHSS